MERRQARLRARAFIQQEPGGPFLLVRHRHPERGEDFWCLPGGWVEPGESLADAVRREVAEETGLTVEPEGLVSLMEFRSGPAAGSVEGVFRARVTGGRLSLGVDPEVETPHLADVRWWRWEEAAGQDLRPRELIRRLAAGQEPVPYTEVP
ncbi:NUDIX hydrolase [Candidatus Hydrogenisulfobacillus filiaventi]|uniref:NUDIX hydrolase n=1 Tax=Candidatus Hydrogenisulfobacillus filiaventi TaxID=2707344 RepID=A0A6F8ZEM0_9FIRM|nr:NUDIX hydrolase [Bacillota bacterium]CAB1128217.1 NUDIX hydrolase [Candidatus Hydrogenisulfobacillus filiaventi]